MILHIISTYKLKKHVDLDEFMTWVLNVDKPSCLSMPVCLGFNAHKVTGGNRDTLPDIVEIIEVANLDEWRSSVRSPDHSHVMEQWHEFVDKESVLSIQFE